MIYVDNYIIQERWTEKERASKEIDRQDKRKIERGWNMVRKIERQFNRLSSWRKQRSRVEIDSFKPEKKKIAKVEV